MKKRDFKKLMLLGMSAGALVASQAGAAQNNNSGTFLASSCSSKHGCSGYMPSSSNGCGAMPNYTNNNNNGTGQNNGGGYTAYQPMQSSCSAHQPYYNNAPAYQQQNYQAQPQHSCAGFQQAQPSHGCGAPSSNNGGYNSGSQSAYYNPQTQQQAQQPQAQTTYNQWSNSNSGFTADNSRTAPTSGSATASTGQLTESDLLSSHSPLNEQSKMLYQGLDKEGRTLALTMVNGSCNGKNECKGQNSCKTKDHACAGRGSCAGTGNAEFKDKNQAIKVAAMNMAAKRAGAIPASR